MISLSSISSFSFALSYLSIVVIKMVKILIYWLSSRDLNLLVALMFCNKCNLVYFCFESLTCYVHLFQGVERFSSYSGYGKTFEFKGDFKDQSQVEYAPSLPPIVFTTIQPSKLLKRYWN